MISSGRKEKKERLTFKGKNKETVLDTGKDSKSTYKEISWSTLNKGWEACYPLKVIEVQLSLLLINGHAGWYCWDL